MPDKTQESYARLYSMVDMAMHANQLTFQHDFHLMMDFEIAERTPWQELYPSHILHGCLFHYCQAVFRHVSTNGGVRHYRHNPTFRGIVWMAFSLPFVPPLQMREAVELIR